VREPFPADEVEEFHAIRQNPVGIGGRQCCRIGPESEEGRGRVLGAWHPTGLVVGHDVCARGVVEPVDPAADRDAVQIGNDPYFQSLRIHGDPGRVLQGEEPVEGILAGRRHLLGEVRQPFHQSRHLVPDGLLGQRGAQQLAGDVPPALARVQPVEQLDGSVGSVPDHLRERRTLLPAVEIAERVPEFALLPGAGAGGRQCPWRVEFVSDRHQHLDHGPTLCRGCSLLR
jgi:hypothetical protein